VVVVAAAVGEAQVVVALVVAVALALALALGLVVAVTVAVGPAQAAKEVAGCRHPWPVVVAAAVLHRCHCRRRPRPRRPPAQPARTTPSHHVSPSCLVLLRLAVRQARRGARITGSLGVTGKAVLEETDMRSNRNMRSQAACAAREQCHAGSAGESPRCPRRMAASWSSNSAIAVSSRMNPSFL
jgi:hypothetical protein